MRRFVFFVVLCAFSLPVGLSITGCAHNANANYCSRFQSGPKVTDVASIDLEPRTTGISLNYGQISAIQTPSAFNCLSTSVSVKSYTYGTTNLNLADISPNGTICGGTWNRHTGNGVPDFTTCIPPTQSGIGYITASAGGATSNPVPVFVHAPVTSVILGSGTPYNCPNNPISGSPGGPVYQTNSCLSQNQTAQLVATVCTGNGICTAGSANDITCSVGHLAYVPQNAGIVSIDQNGLATAHAPGGTAISATVSQASSTAGYFFTCPPKSIRLTVGNTGDTSVTVNTNNIQPLTTAVIDTQGNAITGLPLTYSTTDQVSIPVSTTGAVTPIFPGDAAIVATCLPAICNPSPQNEIANLSTGLPITSTPVEVHTPGPTSNILYMASPQTDNFVPVDFQNGNVGSPVRLPYAPNSMVMDQSGNYLYFGSANGLMIEALSTSTSTTLKSQVPGIAGTVLAVSPDDTLVVVHDPCRKLFYLYNPSLGNTAGATASSFGAAGPTIPCTVSNAPVDPSVEINPPYAAAFTLDSQTVYIVNGNTLYTYSKFTGWHTCTDSGQTGNCPVNSTAVAVTVPGEGAFASGTTTTAFGYCALGPNNAGQTAGPPPMGIDPNTALNPTAYYPLAATVPAATDQVAASTDGYHIIGAAAAGDNLTDIDVTIPPNACPLHSPLQFGTTHTTYSLATPAIQSIHQVLISQTSQEAFVTYIPTTPTGGNNTLPGYQIPCSPTQTPCPAGQSTTGAIVHVPLVGQAGAPIGGVFSPDTNTFYVSTSADDLVHFINTTDPHTLADVQQITPGLVCSSTTTAAANPFFACTQGAPVPVFFLAARPRPTQGGTTSASSSPK